MFSRPVQTFRCGTLSNFDITVSPISVHIRIMEVNQYQFTRCDYINSIKNTVDRLIHRGSTVDPWNNDTMISKSNTEIPLQSAGFHQNGYLFDNHLEELK